VRKVEKHMALKVVSSLDIFFLDRPKASSPFSASFLLHSSSSSFFFFFFFLLLLLRSSSSSSPLIFFFFYQHQHSCYFRHQYLYYSYHHYFYSSSHILHRLLPPSSCLRSPPLVRCAVHRPHLLGKVLTDLDRLWLPAAAACLLR